MAEETEKTNGTLFDSMTTAETPTSTELAVVSEQPTGIAAFEEGDIAFDADDISIPRIKLAQALTQEVADGLCSPGEFFTQGFEPMKQLNVVPLAFARRRILIDKDTNEVMCRSGNAVQGVGTPGGTCADCPFNQWTGQAPNRKAPECAFMYSYVVYVREWEMVGIMDFKRTSINAGKIFNTLTQRNGLANFAMQVSAAAQKNKKGQAYYSINVKPTETNAEELSTAKELFSLS